MRKKKTRFMGGDMSGNQEWIYCPVCGSKTRLQIREDSILINFPLYCPKRKQENLVVVKNKQVNIIKEPDT